MIKNIDCLDGLKELSDNSVDTLITDPPYGISFMGKNWDTFNQIDDLTKNDHGSVLYKKGFKKVPTQSSKSMIQFFTPIWKEGYRVLKPGSFAFIFCIPRQDCLSRMIISLEDAGFNTGFTSIYFTFASGFPKSSNISKSIDRKLGNKNVEYKEPVGRENRSKKPNGNPFDTDYEGIDGKIPYHKPTSDQAKIMSGWYSFNPKPAVEIIIVAQKPLKYKSYVDQALNYSNQILYHQKKDIAPGCVNFDDCRIPYESDDDIKNTGDRPVEPHHKKIGEDSCVYEYSIKPIKRTYWSAELTQGRFPSHLLVSDDILNDGKITVSSGGDGSKYKGAFFDTVDSVVKDSKYGLGFGDSGSFSRYFSLDAWWNDKIKKLPESVQKTFPFLITPKASKSEKNKGCEGLPEKRTMITNFQPEKGVKYRIENGVITNLKSKPQHHNIHPCVKPVKLISYLLTLSTRENDIVIDPFIGSGTTAVACKMLNRKCIGFEISNEYYQIAKKRLQSCVTINDWI